MHARDVVLRFIQSIGRPDEAEFYLRAFRAERRRSFAVIAVSASAMRLSADALAVDLRVLSELGLAPVLVFGLVAPGGARADARALQGAIPGDVRCRIAEPNEAGLVADDGAIPLVPVDAPATGDPAAIDARFAALGELTRALETRKVIFLGRRSGLQRESGELLSLVDVHTESAPLRAPGALPPKQAALLAQIERLLAGAPRGLTVAVTSPLELLRELFTERGAGTLLRRGASVSAYDGLAGVDRDRLRALLVSAFEREPRAEFFQRSYQRAYIADDYRGAALVADTALGAYLSKFAVDPRARGEGVGRDLWRAVAADHPALFWRSRRDNPFTWWYARHCDGMAKTGAWCVFWRGLPEGQILGALDYARAAEDDFEAERG